MVSLRLAIILILGVFACGEIHLDAKEKKIPSRSLTYAYELTDSVITVNVYETATGAVQGEVMFARFIPSQEVSRKSITMSKGEFEKIWSAFNAPGVQKRRVSTSSKMQLNNNYIFVVGDEFWAVSKSSSSPEMSALTSRLRWHADAAIKSGKMTSVPFKKQ
jgi:hypothetical protein